MSGNQFQGREKPVDTHVFPVVNRGPLEGVVVIDFTAQLAGPLITYLLAGFGATVIKVEDSVKGDPVRGTPPFIGADGQVSMWKQHADDMSLPILNRSRGKHSITLNLKAPEAKDIYRQLASRADVVVENFAGGTADRLGIGYEATRAINPRIVYCSLSGFGAGAMGDRKALDVVIQAMSGLTMVSGNAGDAPVRVGTTLADMIAPLFAVMGINAALHRRHVTGAGEYVDVSMLGSLTALMAVEEWQAMGKAGLPMRTGNQLQRATPFGIFHCKDGYIAIGAGSRDPFTHALFRAMGRSDMAEDPRYSTLVERCKHAKEVNALVQAWCESLGVEEVETTLLAAGVPVGQVRTPIEAFQEPVVVDRGEVTHVVHPDLGEIESLQTFGIPVRFHCKDYGHGAAAPRLGQHNDAIYGDWLGLEARQIEALRAANII